MIKLRKSGFTDSEGIVVYSILDNEEIVGSIELYETENPELLVIDWIKIPESLGNRTREIVRALKKKYPKVTRLQGLRITGIREEAIEGEQMTEVRI